MEDRNVDLKNSFYTWLMVLMAKTKLPQIYLMTKLPSSSCQADVATKARVRKFFLHGYIKWVAGCLANLERPWCPSESR